MNNAVVWRLAGHQQDAQLLQQRLSQLIAEQSQAAAWVAANPPSSQDQQQDQSSAAAAGPAQPGMSSAESQATRGNAGGWARSSGSQQKQMASAEPGKEAQWKWDILRPL